MYLVEYALYFKMASLFFLFITPVCRKDKYKNPSEFRCEARIANGGYPKVFKWATKKPKQLFQQASVLCLHGLTIN